MKILGAPNKRKGALFMQTGGFPQRHCEASSLDGRCFEEEKKGKAVKKGGSAGVFIDCVTRLDAANGVMQMRLGGRPMWPRER